MAVLDLNDDMNGQLLAKLGQGMRMFFHVDVSDTKSVASAVARVLAWTKSTGKKVGGVVAAAGIGNPAKVRLFLAVLPLLNKSFNP